MSVMDLHAPLSSLFRIAPPEQKALKKLKIETPLDLLFHFPTRYSDMSDVRLVSALVPGETATIYGRVASAKTKKGFRSKIPMGEAVIEDSSGKIKVIWFYQAFIAKTIAVGQYVKLSGKVSAGKDGSVYLANPEFEKKQDLAIDTHDTLFKGDAENGDFFRYPVYAETRGLTSKWIYHHVKRIIASEAFQDLEEYLPEDILAKYKLPTLKTALVWIHTPRKADDAAAARKRFAFEEVFLIQLKRQGERKAYRAHGAFSVTADESSVDDFVSRFPFEATAGQKAAIAEILRDMTSDRPMSRLLEGDVGSGKTAVAATAAYAAVASRPRGQSFGNLQVAYMAPTEILATQHFESFIQYFRHMGIQVGLITGSGCRKFPSKVDPSGWTAISRAQLLKWVANGEIPILIGTHALVQKSVKFKHLALAIIDEQHRFGTRQRASLSKKEERVPHLLSMTATPIPRTLALTMYGDLDLSVLDQMPAGRKPVMTEIVGPDKRDDAYEKAKEELAKGRQVYVICPRIDEPDPDKETALLMKSAVAEAARLKRDVFKDKTIGILHSKMTKEKKEKVMDAFSKGETDILVATSVVEVGVNVPNATVIIIEGAERFGLAQLHQLRGRVIRSSHQAYCFLFADAKSEKTMERLRAIVTAKNGFELAELDLSMRGAGELAGGKQWGVSDLAMEALRNIKMVQFARDEAIRLVEEDDAFSNYPRLKAVLAMRHAETHFE